MSDITSTMLEFSLTQSGATTASNKSQDAMMAELEAAIGTTEPSKSMYVDTFSIVSDFSKTLINCQSSAKIYLKRHEISQLNAPEDDSLIKEKIKKKINMVSTDASL